MFWKAREMAYHLCVVSFCSGSAEKMSIELEVQLFSRFEMWRCSFGGLFWEVLRRFLETNFYVFVFIS